MNIKWTNFQTARLPEKFTTNRIEKISKLSEKTEFEVLHTKIKVSDILDMKNSEKRVDIVFDLIKKIDQDLNSGKNILLIPEYKIFENFYYDLSDNELRYISSSFVSEEGSIFDEFRREYLKSSIFRYLRLPNSSSLKDIFEKNLVEYKNKRFDLDFLFSELRTEEEKEAILSVLQKK